MLHKTLLLVVVRAIQQIILIGRFRGSLVKKRHSYRCKRGSDYKPVAVARYINLVREPWSSLSLSLSWQAEVASAFILPLPELALVCADYKKLVYASWLLHALAFISGHPSLFFLSLSLSPQPGPFTKAKWTQLRLFSKRYANMIYPVTWEVSDIYFVGNGMKRERITLIENLRNSLPRTIRSPYGILAIAR